jgi:hypothetical protein
MVQHISLACVYASARLLASKQLAGHHTSAGHTKGLSVCVASLDNRPAAREHTSMQVLMRMVPPSTRAQQHGGLLSD